MTSWWHTSWPPHDFVSSVLQRNRHVQNDAVVQPPIGSRTGTENGSSWTPFESSFLPFTSDCKRYPYSRLGSLFSELSTDLPVVDIAQPTFLTSPSSSPPCSPLSSPEPAILRSTDIVHESIIEPFLQDSLKYCRNQKGCRFLQKLLSEEANKYFYTIYSNIIEHFDVLISDPFGNYLCQKVYDVSTSVERTAILAKINHKLLIIATNQYGTRALQKILEASRSNPQVNITSVLNQFKGHIVDLCLDAHGNHLVQKLMSCLTPAMNQFVYDEIYCKLRDISMHRHGCCVIQRSLDYASPLQQAMIVNKVLEYSCEFVEDPFGNYVVQYVLDLGCANYISSIVKSLKGRICGLSMNKIASNVIEKCIKAGTADDCDAIIKELIDFEPISVLSYDNFANYVIQTAYDYANADQRSLLIRSFRHLGRSMH